MLDERGRQVRAVGKRARNPAALGEALRAVLHRRYAACAWTAVLDVVSRPSLWRRPLGAGSRLRDDMRRAIAEVARVYRSRTPRPVYLCHHVQRALSTCRAWARRGTYGSTCGGICLAAAARWLSTRFSACVLCGDPMLSYFSTLRAVLCAGRARHVSARKPELVSGLQRLHGCAPRP